MWIDFDPQAGREQAGRRPGLVVSSALYNGAAGLALVCPITRSVKGYPFEVRIPEHLSAIGCVLADHVKSVDWRKRRAERIGTLPPDVTAEVIGRINAILTQ